MSEARKEAMVSQLHLIGRIEGTSLLLLLLVAMPLKYLAGQPLAVLLVGSAHGALWILYLLALARVWIGAQWPFATVFLGGVASVLPFGPWWFESWTGKRVAAA